MDPWVQKEANNLERSKQSGKKPVLGLLCTIIRGGEHSHQKSAGHEKSALAHEHN